MRRRTRTCGGRQTAAEQYPEAAKRAKHLARYKKMSLRRISEVLAEEGHLAAPVRKGEQESRPARPFAAEVIRSMLRPAPRRPARAQPAQVAIGAIGVSGTRTLAEPAQVAMCSMDDLSPEECQFLLLIGEAGIVAFHPREDEVIAFLMDSGLVASERVDGHTALIRLTSQGHTVAARLRDSMG
jgi:hypothetical protein